MADAKVSALTAVTVPDLTDEFYTNQGGVPKKITRAVMLDAERYVLRADASRNLTSQTARQPLFDPAADVLTLPVGTYRFDLMLLLTSMSGTSGNAQLDLLGAGTAVAAAWLWAQQALDATAIATAAALSGGWNTGATSAAPLAVAGTGTGLGVHAYGTFEITTAGTFIPSILLTTAAAAAVAAGSHFWAERISSSTSLVSIGPAS